MQVVRTSFLGPRPCLPAPVDPTDVLHLLSDQIFRERFVNGRMVDNQQLCPRIINIVWCISLPSLQEYIENTSWKELAYGIYARVVDVSEIERVSTANE